MSGALPPALDSFKRILIRLSSEIMDSKIVRYILTVEKWRRPWGKRMSLVEGREEKCYLMRHPR